jgi:hypothetical protein
LLRGKGEGGGTSFGKPPMDVNAIFQFGCVVIHSVHDITLTDPHFVEVRPSGLHLLSGRARAAAAWLRRAVRGARDWGPIVGSLSGGEDHSLAFCKI